MNSKYEAALADYVKFAFADGPWTRPVYRRGSGPAVIVIHEIPGLHPLVIRFADRIVAAGMTVFLPVPVRRAGQAGDLRLRVRLDAVGRLHPPRIQCLVHRQARARSSTGCARWRDRRTPNAAAGRRRGRHVLHRRLRARHDDRAGGRRAGAVAALIAGCGDVDKARRWNRCSPARRDRLRRSAVRERRPVDDRRCASRATASFPTRASRPMPRIRRQVRGASNWKTRTPPRPTDAPHSVLTIHLREDGPTKVAEQRVIAFFEERTGAWRCSCTVSVDDPRPMRAARAVVRA